MPGLQHRLSRRKPPRFPCPDPEDPVRNNAAVRGCYWYHSSNTRPGRTVTSILLCAWHRKRGGAWSPGAGRRGRRELGEAPKDQSTSCRDLRGRDREHVQAHARPGWLGRAVLPLSRTTRPKCVIEPGVHQEPTDWVGDAHLADVCAPGSNVLRYVNVHEDQSNVSLALEPTAVRAVQKTPIPLAVDTSDRWIVDATKRLLSAASKPSEHDRTRAPGRGCAR